MKEPKVSIILVNYNGYRDTLECIKSLRNTDYNNFEVVIVDNGSSDGSLERIKEGLKSNEVLISIKENKGFSAGNNVGIKYGCERKSEYFLLLNNDTIVEPGFLRHLIWTAKNYKDKAIVTPKILYYYDKNKIWYAGGRVNRATSRTTHVGINEYDCGQYNKRKDVDFVSGCCMLLSKEIIQSVGLMNEDYFLYCEDLEYCLRVINKGYKLVYEPESVIYHKVNASSGKQSDTVTYYTIRNKLYVIDQYFQGPQIIFAKTYNIVESIKRVIFGEYRLKTMLKAVKAYKNKEKGKTDG